MKKGISKFFDRKSTKIFIFIVFILGGVLNLWQYFEDGKRGIDIVAAIVYFISAAFQAEDVLAYYKKKKNDSGDGHEGSLNY